MGFTHAKVASHNTKVLWLVAGALLRLLLTVKSAHFALTNITYNTDILDFNF